MSSRAVFHWVGSQRRSLAKILSVLLLLALLLTGQPAPPAHATGGALYVAPSGLNSGTCGNWANACSLQRALGTVAGSGDELWVKQGTYKPSVPAGRYANFTLKDGVRIYGGFAGTETAFGQRNPATHVTVLSGDIGIAGTRTDNVYHVLTGPSSVTSSTVLDGFTVTAGYAYGSGFDGVGGGMYNSGNPTLSNLTFSGNFAGSAAGMNNDHSSPVLTNVTFSGNQAVNGGGMGNDHSSPTLTNVTFSGNSAVVKGGGMYNQDSSPTLTNVTFSGNSAEAAGGGAMYNDSDIAGPTSSPIIYDSIFWGDGSEIVSGISYLTIYDSIVSGSTCPPSSYTVCEHVLTSNPLLGPLANNGGYTKTRALGAGSPAINAGDVWSPAHCAPTDQRGVRRPQGTRCDMGAYEAPVTVSFRSVGSQDGWIRESGENTNVGGGTPNSTGATLILGDDTARRQYRSIVSFNTASLPNNAVISSVKLKLKRSSVSPAGTNPISLLHGIMLDVRKGFFGTSALQLQDFQQVPAGTITMGPFSPGLSAGFYTITFTPASFSRINLLATTQIRLRFRLGDNNNAIANTLKLVSGNNPTAANRPTLIIVYTTP